MSNSLNDAPVLLDPAIVDAVLDDIDGGVPNLLPVEALLVPLPVRVPMWKGSNPSPEYPEILQLLWNSAVISTKFWTTPVVPEEDLLLQVEQRHLVEGVHELEYNVTLYNGESMKSHALPLAIDKSPPSLGGNQGELVFPLVVIECGLTWQYLEDYQDRVIAVVPDYPGAGAGDVLTWYWDSTPFEFLEAGKRTLAISDIGKPLELVFEGELIRERGDGERYVHYGIEDRAGNPSIGSRPVVLQVSASRVPRELPWLTVEKAVGEGEEVELDPDDGRTGVRVLLDADVPILPDEEVWVQWGEPGSVADFQGLLDKDGDPRSCRVPKESVIAMIGQTVKLHYQVKGQGDSQLSTPQSVRITKVPVPEFPTVQCEGVTTQGLSLAKVPESGARLTLEWWKLMTTDQVVRIVVDGVDATDQMISHLALDDHRVTEDELGVGLGFIDDVVISKAFLSQLKIDQVFVVKVYVSFDRGVTWPSESLPTFPSLTPKLIP